MHSSEYIIIIIIRILGETMGNPGEALTGTQGIPSKNMMMVVIFLSRSLGILFGFLGKYLANL